MKAINEIILPSILVIGTVIGAILNISIWHFLGLILVTLYSITPIRNEGE